MHHGDDETDYVPDLELPDIHPLRQKRVYEVILTIHGVRGIDYLPNGCPEVLE